MSLTVFPQVHLTPIRMATMKKKKNPQNRKFAGKDVEKLEM